MTLPSRLFCDTSFLYASLDPTDVNHARATGLLERAVAARAVLWATWDVVSETVTLLRHRRNFRAALAFLTEVRPQLRLVVYGDRLRHDAEEVFRLHGRARPLSFCDAISFVVVTTLLDMPCLAFDEDFRRLGLAVVS